MATDLLVFVCPTCQKPFRVPPDLLGRVARCPYDGSPVPTAMGKPRPWLLTVSGILLVLLSLPSLWVGTKMLIVTIKKPEIVQEAVNAGLDEKKQTTKLPLPGNVDAGPIMVGVVAGMLALSLIQLAGGVALLCRRGYWLAWAGVGAAALNATPLISVVCACFAGIPAAGLGAAGLLHRPTRALFDGSK